MTPKIIELIIEDSDDNAGLDGIALVEHPAHEATFEYFNESNEPKKYVLSDEEIPEVIQMFSAYGEPQGFLEDEGWYIDEVRDLGHEGFASILANPNAPSAQDTPTIRYRYKYVGPKDQKNRTFCAEMMAANKVFRIEDIDKMSNRSVNPVGPDGYSIFEWRGSYNCRHKWVQLVYRSRGKINNDANSTSNLSSEDGMPGPDTRTSATIAAGNTPPRTGFSKENMEINVSGLSPYVDQVTKEIELEPVLTGDYAAMKVSIDYDDTLSTERGFQLAQRLLEEGVDLYIISARQDKEPMMKRADNLGIPSSKVFATGSNTAKVEKIKSLGIERHIDNSADVVKKIEEELPEVVATKFSDFGLEEACWPGYEAIGMKIGEDGREVPNCVPEKMAMEMMKQEFQSYDDYPSSARNNACKAIRWKEEHGDEVRGMTQVGWIRANQLCKGEKISEETIARMSGFQRHRRNAEVSPEFKDTPWKDSGYIAWLGWGGTTGIDWASNKLKTIRNEMSEDTNMTFSVFNNEQRLVVGPAMIPDKMIIRRNEITGEIYYVYFTAETIKKLQQKFMRDKLLDATNIEHQRKYLRDVDVVESWIVDDVEKDKQQVFNMNYPVGTWMIILKVSDDDVWKRVKDGELKGFSVQGYFLEKAKFRKDTELIQQIKDILSQVK